MDAYVEKDAVEVSGEGRRPSEDPAVTPPETPGTAAGAEAAEAAGAVERAEAAGAIDGPKGSEARSGVGIMALSLPYQVVVAVALAVVGVFACVHLAMVFLHVAPSNTLTKRHGEAVDDWIYPEFEQNWKLFAPNPLQTNIAVEVRAELVTADGGRRTTDWIDLTAQDIEAVRHNPMPSHAQQNQLRRAVDFYLNTHNDGGRPNGLRGTLSEQYMRRIAMLRLDALEGPDGRAIGADARRIQLRTVSRPVPAPRWSTEKTRSTPSYRDFPWWIVTEADRTTGAGASRTEAGR
ncbi:DUF5819 family protein [Streptomyces vietnamensis]|uniref:Membrane protein n=1 Tax=Streptomyces vietnamensis TaxID=362257 RepID=A0A0B5I0G5_9ACTN|nr:DUF5819 family protein [Streptomyces vietnamensis]AJF66101.1 membrane protein [Streptomyces vietnamensis]